MKKNLKRMIKLAFVLTMLTMVTNVWSQTLPFVIANKSEFPDDQVYVGLTGRVNDVSVWFDCATQTVKPIQSSDNTVTAPNGTKYANCFTKLSNIPNKTLNLPQIASVRIFIAFKNQLYLYFFADGGYSAPDLNNPSDPNQGIRYEIIELTYNTIGLWANTTRVDNYQYPMGLEVWGSNIAYQKVGEIKTHQEILDAWKNTVPASFQGCYDATLGIIHAPSKTAAFKEGGSMYNYFDSYVNQIWDRYKNEDLTIGIGDAGSWKGRVQADGQRFVFTRVSDGRVGIVEARPNTQEILEGKGVLAHDVPETPTADDLDVQKHFCAAFNRGAINPNAPAGVAQYWGNEADFFINNSYNQYVKFWHRTDISYDGQTYAFCYDDVFDYSSTIMATNPTKAIITIGGFANSPAQVLTSISVTPVNSSIMQNATQQFTATGLDQFGVPMTITPTWTATGGTISTTGLFTGSATGTFTVRATSGSISGTASVTVNPIDINTNLAKNKPVTVSSIENAGTPGTMAVDGNAGTRWSSAASDPQWIMVDLQSTFNISKVVLNWETAAAKSYQVQVSPDGINNWTNIYTTTTGTAGVATHNVSGTGRFIRVYGTVRTTGYGYSLWEFEVYGTPGNTIPVTGVTLNAPTATLNTGATIQLAAAIIPSNATNKNVTWSSNNTAIATVNSTGLVTGIATGSATITVTTVDGNFKANCAITVGSTSNIALNKPVTVSSIENAGTPGSAGVDGNAGTRWSSLPVDPQIFMIDLGASYNITRVVLNWETASAKAYQIQVSADGINNWTTIFSTTNGVGGVAVHNVTGTGRFIRVYCTVRNTGWGYSLWEFEVYGTPATEILPTGVSISPVSGIINVGSTLQLTATVSPSNATNKTVIWTSSNTAIATVSSTGLVTGVAPGSVIITARTAAGSLTATCNISVVNPNIPVTGVSVNPINVTLQIGSTSQLSATVAPANATNKTVSWSTSNAAVATVNATGLVTGIAVGTAIITVTTQDGGFKAASSFTVTTRINLALNKPVTVSSIENAGTPGSAAVDGNTGTRWASAFSDPQWITVDLGANYNITQVVLRWEAAYAKAYQVQLSLNNTSWTTAYSTTTSTGGNQTHNVTGQARYVRIYCTTRATGWGNSLWEIEIYGDLLKTADDEINNSMSISENVSFYPNPVSTQLNILFDEEGKYNNISLFDFSGKLVLSQNIESVESSAIVNVELLKSGIYIMKLSGISENKIFKIIKN